MLKSLIVKNFAIIEDIKIDFHDSMTVLTGQTGAGKSLIIDSISLLLGARADTDLIRFGESVAIIEGNFTNLNQKVLEILAEFGIKNDTIVIRREIHLNSKSVIKINDLNITLNQLKNLGNNLADIHVQNDTLRLFNPENYISIIDQYGHEIINNVFNEYQIALFEYRQAINQYEKTLAHNKALDERIDILKFQYEELNNFCLKEKEDLELEDIITKMNNFDKIFENIKNANEFLDDLTSLHSAYISMDKLKQYDEKFLEYSKTLENSYYEIKEISNDLKVELKKLDFDPNELNNAIQRLNDLRKLEKKYKKNLAELIPYFDEVKRDILMQENYDSLLEEDKQNVLLKYEKIRNQAFILLDTRKKIADKMTKGLMTECLELDLNNLQFKIDFIVQKNDNPFDKAFFNEQGVEKIDFLLSLNLGEPIKPLSKIASGGELSRIMLGFKTILANTQNLNLIIFDEIDSGISGITASKIAKKIHKISKNIQVLCITHLPNVASIADHHIMISKVEENHRTKTLIKYLDFEERVKEIALMISGERVSEASLSSAREMIIRK